MKCKQEKDYSLLTLLNLYLLLFTVVEELVEDVEAVVDAEEGKYND
jgi:hypothetical protein